MSSTEKLNLGCGEDYREGYTNVDIREGVDPDVVADIRDLPFEDNSFDFIIMQDILEHFKNWGDVLLEVKRILRPRGEILIRVPNWEKICRPEFWKERPFDKCENKILGGRTNSYDVHKSLWTKDIAVERLTQLHFGKIRINKFNKPPLHWHLGIKAINPGD